MSGGILRLLSTAVSETSMPHIKCFRDYNYRPKCGCMGGLVVNFQKGHFV